MKLYKAVQLRIKVTKQYDKLITGDEITNGVLDRVKEAFEKVETQPDSVEKYGGLDKGPATYGVVKKLRDNDMELHTNKQVQLICSMLFVIFQVLTVYCIHLQNRHYCFISRCIRVAHLLQKCTEVVEMEGVWTISFAGHQNHGKWQMGGYM